MRLSIVSPAAGHYRGTRRVLSGVVQADVPAGGEHVRGCGGGSSADIPAGRGPYTGLRRWLERKRPGRVVTMYGVAAVARWCSFGPGIWAGISSCINTPINTVVHASRAFVGLHYIYRQRGMMHDLSFCVHDLELGDVREIKNTKFIFLGRARKINRTKISTF